MELKDTKAALFDAVVDEVSSLAASSPQPRCGACSHQSRKEFLLTDRPHYKLKLMPKLFMDTARSRTSPEFRRIWLSGMFSTVGYQITAVAIACPRDLCAHRLTGSGWANRAGCPAFHDCGWALRWRHCRSL